jgi:Tfp pilus assembly protein PilF
MARLGCWGFLIVVLIILTGCASRAVKDQPVDQPRAPRGGAEQQLDKGIKSYEDGDYKSAARQLQNALTAGLPRNTDSAKAHKYLAFIACGSGNTKRCRDEFRKAFDDDPNFALDAAEAGHPVWGPVYQGVRSHIKAK